jgi:hypothetical protein
MAVATKAVRTQFVVFTRQLQTRASVIANQAHGGGSSPDVIDEIWSVLRTDYDLAKQWFYALLERKGNRYRRQTQVQSI